MSDAIAAEFKDQYRKKYGGHAGRAGMPPDYTRCAETVYESGRWFGSHQCRRKNGYGPHGAWCKQHDPEAKKALLAAKQQEWRRKWDADEAEHKFRAACIDAIEKIADGHNDPRGLAASIVAERNKAKP